MTSRWRVTSIHLYDCTWQLVNWHRIVRRSRRRLCDSLFYFDDAPRDNRERSIRRSVETCWRTVGDVCSATASRRHRKHRCLAVPCRDTDDRCTDQSSAWRELSAPVRSCLLRPMVLKTHTVMIYITRAIYRAVIRKAKKCEIHLTVSCKLHWNVGLR